MATQLLTENMDKLHLLAKELKEKETLKATSEELSATTTRGDRVRRDELKAESDVDRQPVAVEVGEASRPLRQSRNA